MKYANAISPDRMNATGRVNRPSKKSVPPTTSITPANHTSDPSGAVPPPGRIAAGNANNLAEPTWMNRDRKSTRLNSNHVEISYAVFCLKKKKKKTAKKWQRKRAVSSPTSVTCPIRLEKGNPPAQLPAKRSRYV